MLRTLISWSLLACLLARPVFAQSPEVKRFFNAAITMYENLEYEKALKQLQKARAKASGPDDEAKIGLLEGIVLADMGKEERALTAFKTAFGLDPDAKLPVDVSPKVTAIAEKARANVRKMLAPQLERERAEKKAAEEKLLAEKQRAADEQARALPPPPMPAAEANRVAAPAPAPSAGLRVGAWVAGGVGLLSAGAATFFLVSASGKYASLTGRTVAVGDAASTRDSGKLFATLGYALTGVAVAGLAASAVLFVVSGQSAKPVQVSVMPTANGAMLGLGGTF